MKDIKVSLIVPSFNEESNIEPMYKVIEENFKSISYEIIFVDDGSKDNTFNEIKKLNGNNVVGIRFSRNFGKEAAMLAGLKKAQGEYCCIIDADLQQDPSYVLKMIEILDNNEDIDCVCARQAKRSDSKGMSFIKKCFYKIIDRMSEVNFELDASDFRTFRSNVKDALIDMPEYFRFSKGLFSWVGFNTEYIDYEANERLSGETKWSFRGLFRYAINGITSFSVMPLRISLFAGVFISIVAFIYMIVEIVRKLLFMVDVPGYTTIVVLILFSLGIQLIVLGLIGEYLSKLYIENKRRPVYIVKEEINYEE